METDLTSKIPLREHIRNMRKILDVVRDMDKWYFFYTSIVHIINVAVPYLGLMLSAYLLDHLQGGDFREIMAVTAGACFGIFLLNFTASTIWNRMEVRREKMYYLYTSMIEAKMLTMDFSRIDSPEVRQLKERINRDMNWGWGLNTVFFNFNEVLYGIYQILISLVLGMPLVIGRIASGHYEVLPVMGIVFLLVVLGMKCRGHFRKIQEAYMYHAYSPSEDGEKEEFFTFCWPFAQGDICNYKSGKDIRIYRGYDLMKRWTVDVLKKRGFRSQLWQGVKGAAGEGFFGSSVYALLEGSAYLMVSVISLGAAASIGNVVKFAGIFRGFLLAAANLVMSLQNFALTARRHISTLELLELKNEMYAGKLPMEKRSDNQYQIEFRNVSFRYPGTESYALRDFSMKLTIGEKLAIVGMNGSGKTTMIKLLCRLYDPEEGEILLNGVDIRKFKQEEYSHLFSVVFQDYFLFPFELGQNVAVSSVYKEEKVRECLCGAGFGERMETIPDGVRRYLYKDFDDNGLEISGGEAQKIALARAVYKDAPFILLDEPTAALDPLSEYEIYTNFDKIVGTKTAIYISHRLSSCRFCEKIAVFHEGRLVQLGSHEELVKDTKGKYYEMWNAQAQYYQLAEGNQA